MWMVEHMAWSIQYCAKVMQAKCMNFVLYSLDFSMKVCSKVQLKFRSLSSDNSLQQRTGYFFEFFDKLTKNRVY